MSTETREDPLANLSREELMGAMFANLVFQNTNMALMFLGRVPHPETGEKTVDTEAARMFIDQLEMLEAKTKGNLTPDEQKLLQQSLTHLRLTFVEVVQNPAAAAPSPSGSTETPKPSASEAKVEASATPEDDDPRKRFTKKY